MSELVSECEGDILVPHSGAQEISALDILIKGDVQKMKEKISLGDRKACEKESNIFAALFAAVVLTPVPLVHFLSYAGIGIWVILSAVTFWFAGKVEKSKKAFDIQTYKEIVVFTEGKCLDEIEKAREEGKRPYQKILLAAASALIALAAASLMMWILK